CFSGRSRLTSSYGDWSSDVCSSDLVAGVRAVRPDVAFGADLIAGFPTESEAMFENTLQLVEAAGLAFLHVFPFSPRPGTPAARIDRKSVGEGSSGGAAGGRGRKVAR